MQIRWKNEVSKEVEGLAKSEISYITTYFFHLISRGLETQIHSQHTYNVSRALLNSRFLFSPIGKYEVVVKCGAVHRGGGYLNAFLLFNSIFILKT